MEFSPAASTLFSGHSPFGGNEIKSLDLQNNESRHSFDWTIPKFLSLTSQKIVSPTFSVGIREVNFAASWKLVLYPQGDDQADEYVSLYMEDMAMNQSDQYLLSFQFSILNKFNLRCNIMTSERKYSFVQGRAVAQKCGFAKFIKKSDIAGAATGLLLNDELKINFVLHFKKTALFNTGFSFPGAATSTPSRLVFPAKDPSRTGFEKPFGSSGADFSVDIGRVLWQHVVDKKYSDVVFEVGDEEFLLHRNVMSRSPVFDSMFESNMKEANEKRVTITDCEPAVFRELARYIYTGTPENLTSLAGKLILCADKYCMEGLKAMCEANLIANMSAEKAAETLQLADLLNSELLKKETLLFIKSRPVEVVESEGWKRLSPQLTAEVTVSLAKMIQESLIHL